MIRQLLLISFFVVFVFSQTETSRIPIKVNIVFNPKGSTASSGCTSGNCKIYDPYSTTPIPSTIAPKPYYNPYSAPQYKIIRIPTSYSNYNYNNGCSGSGCNYNQPRQYYYSPSCGNNCRQYGNQQYLIIRPNNANSNIAKPDKIYRHGKVFNPVVRVPKTYKDGNPVFNIN